MQRLIARHQMQDEDGNQYEVLEYQDVVDTSTKEGPSSMDGMTALFLEDGTRLNHIDDDTFELVWPKKILRRAP
jgi:hypothetical protein